MANNNQSSGGGEQFREYLSDLGKLIARFFWDLAKMLGKGAMLLYRSIGQRRTQPERDADRSARKADNALNDAAQQRQSTPRREEPSDAEAASMLDELLQQSRTTPDETPTDTAAAEPSPADDSENDLELPTDIETLEQQVESKVKPQPDANEQERIQQQLAERRAMLEKEREERQRAFEEDEKRKSEREQAVQSDLERIREERRQQEEAFQRAESERRGRLTDDAPTTDDADTDDVDDQSDDRQQGSSAG